MTHGTNPTPGLWWSNVVLNVFTVVIAGGLCALVVQRYLPQGMTSSGSQYVEPLDAIEVPLDADDWKGSRDARVAIIEFSDFQCPYCGEYARTTYLDVKRQFVETGRVQVIQFATFRWTLSTLSPCTPPL